MKKQGTETLWRACFNDTDKFIRLFFDEIYQEDNALVIEKQGQIVSALHLLPYTMLLNGTEFPVSYICGVSTHPDERGKGMMNRLMQEAEEELKRRGIPLALLIPAETWLFDIYKKFGYHKAFSYHIETYTSQLPPASENIRISIATATTPGLFSFFDKKLRERPAYVLHTEKDFMVIRKDFAICNGQLLIATNIRNEITGMAFTLPERKEGEPAFIADLLYNNLSIKEQLLYATAKLYNVSKVNYQTLPCKKASHPKGMAKIIDENYFRDKEIDIQSLFKYQKGFMTLMLD